MITITKNGYIHFKDKCIGNNVILTMLGEKVELEEGFTLQSLFKMFNLYPNLVKLEAYLPMYLNLYNTTVDEYHSEEPDNYKTILFNTYLLEKKEVALDKKHNLAIKFKSGHVSNINNYQIFDMINFPIKISDKIITLTLEPNPDYSDKSNEPKNIYVRQPVLNIAKYTCDLFYFIMFMCGSLFKGMDPSRRRQQVEMNELSYSIMADDIVKEIDKILMFTP